MADERHYDRSYNSLEGYGLGSIHSCLDGVPFKIGTRFRPPEKIQIDPELLKITRCPLLDEQYSFETEEGVLAWIRAKEETRRRQQRESEERKARVLEEFAAGTATDSDSTDDDISDFNFGPEIDSSAINPPPSNPTPLQPVIPKFDSILTPIQAKTPEPAAEAKPISTLDLTMFEKEKDAFENLDLQAINDMEELKNLFQDSQVMTQSANANISNETTNSQQSASKPYAKPKAKPRTKVNSVQPEAELNVDEGDYISLRMNFGQNSVKFNNVDNTNLDAEPGGSSLGGASIGGPMPSHMVNSGLYKPVLPPIHGMPQSGLKPVMNGLNGINPQILSNEHQSEQTVQYSNFPVANTRYSPNNVYELETKVDGRLRNAKSNPDLSDSTQQNVSPRFSMSHTPPPVPIRPVDKSVTYENWNLKHRPVPPIPATKPKPKPSSIELVNNSSTSSSETDPYSTLSVTDKLFVNKLGCMGFPRPRVSRAVAKLGQDEKQVIDHLCHVDSLIGKGYNPVNSESALFLFGNNIDKASSYIEMYSQFQELGFQAEKIKEALIKNDVDRDKALDELMAS